MIKLVQKQKAVPTAPSRIIISLLVISFVFAVAESFGQKSRPQSNPRKLNTERLSPRQIAEKVSNSLVTVITEDIEGKVLAQGSGFFYGIPKSLFDRDTGDPVADLKRLIDRISNDRKPLMPFSSSVRSNLIITNLHVFKRAWSGRVKLVGSENT